jgi:MFS family permease
VSGGRRLGRILLDTAPLRQDRDYRWLWIGQAVSGMGTQITRLALPYQVYELTGSTVAIAALMVFQVIPIFLFALGGGALADAVDRRKLLLATQVGLAASSLGLVATSLLTTPPLLALFVLAFIAGGLAAVEQPARTASIPRLVPPERLSPALALNQLNIQVAKIAGPAAAGILIATLGLAGAYLVDALTFVVSIAVLLGMAPIPPLASAVRPGVQAIIDGLRFTLGRRVILGSFLMDLAAMVLAAPMALLPVLALDVFGVGPIGLGLLAASPAVGALGAALLSGWINHVSRVGRAVVVAVVTWGLAIAALGLMAIIGTPLAFIGAMACLSVAGAADVISAVFRTTIVQLAAPDEMRGRVLSIHTLVVSAGPRVGDIQISLVAAAVGPGLALLVGGGLCIVAVVAVVRGFPEFAQHVIDRRGERPPT